MTAERLLVLLAGVVVLLGTARSVLTVLIVPRPASSFVVYPVLVVRAAFRRVSQLARTYAGQGPGPGRRRAGGAGGPAHGHLAAS